MSSKSKSVAYNNLSYRITRKSLISYGFNTIGNDYLLDAVVHVT